MTEVLVKVQDEVQQVSLDLQDPRVELNFEIQNNTKLSERSSPHSLSFNCLRTKKNNQFFEHYHNVNISTSTWSAYSDTIVEVLDDGILVLSGVLQLNEVNDEAYSVNVLGITADLFRAIRGKSFADLFDFIGTDTDHALTAANIISSWTVTNDITNGSVGNATVVYPLVDHGQYPFGWFLAGNFVQSGLNNHYVIQPSHLKPSIKVQYLFEQILNYAGYTTTYDSELSTPRWTKLYMLTGTEQKSVAVRPMYGAKVRTNSTLTIPANTQTTTSLLFTYEIGAYFDPDNLFQSGVFVAPFTGTFTFFVQLVTQTTATGDYYFSVNIASPDETFNDQVIVPAAANSGYLYTQTFVMNVTAGDSVSLSVGANCSAAVDVVPSLNIGDSFISVPQYNTENPTGAIVDMAANMPDMTLDKWLKGIIEKFNIILEYDNDTPTRINVSTALTYFSSGVEKDWTAKLDLSKNKVIKPTTELQSKRIIFEDHKGEDHRNEWWQRNWGWVKGKYTYENQNDFAVDEETIGGTFVPFRSQAIRKNSQTEETLIPNVLVSRQWINSENGAKNISNKPILAYYNGLRDIGNGYNFIVDTTSVTEYPLFSPYSRLPVASATVHLNWGYDYPDDDSHPFVEGIPFSFMFRKYWAKYINEIYSEDARLMECSLFLTPQDVRDMRHNDNIWIEDSYWRILSISNYVVNGSQPCKAKLLKVIDKGDWECRYYPKDYNANGTITFTDSVTGSTSDGNKDCCELFGYKWNTATNKCHYITSGGTIGGNPTVPSFESAYTLDGGATKNPLPIPNSFNKSYSATTFTATQSMFAMEGETTSNTYATLKIIGGGNTIPLEPNTFYGVELDVLVIQTGGTSGTVGDVDYIKATAAVKSILGTSQSVGNFVTLSSHSDHNHVHGLQWFVAAGATRPALLQLQVSGQNNHTLTWYVNAKVTAMNAINLL